MWIKVFYLWLRQQSKPPINTRLGDESKILEVGVPCCPLSIHSRWQFSRSFGAPAVASAVTWCWEAYRPGPVVEKCWSLPNLEVWGETTTFFELKKRFFVKHGNVSPPKNVSIWNFVGTMKLFKTPSVLLHPAEARYVKPGQVPESMNLPRLAKMSAGCHSFTKKTWMVASLFALEVTKKWPRRER